LRRCGEREPRHGAGRGSGRWSAGRHACERAHWRCRSSTVSCRTRRRCKRRRGWRRGDMLGRLLTRCWSCRCVRGVWRVCLDACGLLRSSSLSYSPDVGGGVRSWLVLRGAAPARVHGGQARHVPQYQSVHRGARNTRLSPRLQVECHRAPALKGSGFYRRVAASARSSRR
jgi:hypothetical protein